MTATPNAEYEQSTRSASSISGVVKVAQRGGGSGSRELEPRIADLARSPRIAVRDVISGSISALVTISYSLSFAAMIFSGPLKGHLEDGVRMSLMSAGLTLILVALTSPFFFAIAGPDSRSAAVQAAMAMMLTEKIADKDPSPHIVFALALSTAVTGIALYVLGKLKMGRWVRYIPYPVVGGFLVSTGWVLAVGGMRVMVPPDVQVNFDLLPQLIQRGAVGQTLFGVGFAATMFFVLGRAQQYFALPALLVGGTLLTHLIIAVDPELTIATAQESGWLLRVSDNLNVSMPFIPFATGALEWPAVRNFIFEVITLISVTAIAVLVTAAAIEVATKRDADLDQELKGHGIANIVSGLCGGIVGSNAVARSMLNLQAGAATRLSGVIAGTLCLFVLFISPKLASLLSRPVLGATLAYLGLRLLQEWLFKAYWKLQRTDYMLVVLMLVLIIVTGIFVVGLFVGALASCLIFAVNYSRVSVVKNSFTLDEYGSKVQRSAEENQVLRVRGRQYWVLRLRGYLFFGSIVGLVADIRQRIRRSYAQDAQPLKSVVVDFRYVNGMDSSTALTLVKLRQTIEDRRMQLIFTSLNAEMERALRREHCIRDDDVCVVFDDLDAALEWCEQRAVVNEPSLSRIDMPFVQRLAKEFGSLDLAVRFNDYVQRIELKKGEYLFRQGDASGATYVVESGRVSIVLERPDGAPLLLRSVTSNTTLGEMGLYRQSIRSASVVADAVSVVHKLERSALDRMETEAPRVAAAFHTFVIRTLADRLHVADKAISALER
ncbi:MAG: cyclic nucleotide-binding domain-containing protein [Deltaproteobacteria bacterium]|jgi:SulP family sulfate permease|nr:cyclic nucleotide-binding domain-containing protein [Deltaproteobacteria bacterium]